MGRVESVSCITFLLSLTEKSGDEGRLLTLRVTSGASVDVVALVPLLGRVGPCRVGSHWLGRVEAKRLQ
jgi:hypothetical protein